jgi:lipoprotein-anchoring transpeptidase ErfK/SrfK
MEGAVRGEDFETVGQMLRELNLSTNTSLIPLLTVERYTVAPNDSLWKLVNKVFPDRYGVSPEVGLVKLVNGMSSDRLRPGQVLLVPIGELSLKVDTRQHGLVAWLGDVAIAAYRVGLGKDERTPPGTFVIKVKQEDPAWFFDGRVIPHGHPENVLGTRWMGFDDQPGAMGFGIHGTTAPESVGRSESMGCVRMRNPEVEELFEYTSRGTRVVIS